MAKGDSGTGQPQAPKIDQYSVMHRLMDQMGQSDNAMAPTAAPQQMGGRMGAPQMPRDIMQPMESMPNSLAPQGIPDMIRRRMTGMNSYGNQ